MIQSKQTSRATRPRLKRLKRVGARTGGKNKKHGLAQKHSRQQNSLTIRVREHIEGNNGVIICIGKHHEYQQLKKRV